MKEKLEVIRSAVSDLYTKAEEISDEIAGKIDDSTEESTPENDKLQELHVAIEDVTDFLARAETALDELLMSLSVPSTHNTPGQ